MIGNKEDRSPIICFAGSDWWYHNRGLFSAQIMTRLAKRYKVLYVNSIGMRVPSLRKDPYATKKMMRKFYSLGHFLQKINNGMYVFTPVFLPLFGSPIRKAIVTFFLLLQIKLVMILLGMKNPILYVACPTAWEIVKRLRHRYLVFQNTDIYEEMPGVNKSYVASLEDVLTKTADLVLYVNAALWRRGRKKNSNSLLVGHGVDFELFANAEKSEYVAEEIATIPKPIIGFFGDITEDVCDFALLEHTAKTLPDMSLVLVGSMSSDVSNLKAYKNVFFLGQKPYEEVPHYGKVFDVGIMPWKKTKWIEFCNPIKTKEYLALGIPIVSVDYPELKAYRDIVYASSDYNQFTDSICRAVNETDPRLKQKRREKVVNETWDKKVEQILDFIETQRMDNTQTE